MYSSFQSLSAIPGASYTSSSPAQTGRYSPNPTSFPPLQREKVAMQFPLATFHSFSKINDCVSPFSPTLPVLGPQDSIPYLLPNQGRYSYSLAPSHLVLLAERHIYNYGHISKELCHLKKGRQRKYTGSFSKLA